MRRIFSILIGVWIVCGAVSAANKALVIGIGEYPAENGWNRISGDKDVEYVIKTLEANGYAKSDIVTLVNAEATKKNIVSSFNNLIFTCRKGDNVYVHYSGHGQLVTDLNGDEQSGYDEAWVPYDAALAYQPGVYEGENHLLDDEINIILHKLSKKIGAVGRLTVVSDACHSGGVTCDVNEYNPDIAVGDTTIYRGANSIFVMPQNGSEHFKTMQKPVSESWVAISACQYYQSNKECVKIRCGSLTYALYLLRDKLSSISVNTLVPKLKENVSVMANTKRQDPCADAPDYLKNKPIF